MDDKELKDYSFQELVSLIENESESQDIRDAAEWELAIRIRRDQRSNREE